MIKVKSFQADYLFDLERKINEFGENYRIMNVTLSSTDYFAGVTKYRSHYALVMYEENE